MFGWCYGFTIDKDAPPITKPNHKKHLRKKMKMAKTSKRRNRV